MRHRLALLVLFLAARPGFANDAGWTITARPEWVTPVAWELPGGLPDEAPSGGVDYLLFDLQLDRRARSATYVHTVKHLVDQVGVQSESQVEVGFDSLYQEVRLHSIRLYRDGEVLDRLSGASLDVDRRESSREEELYRATRSIRAYLDDVRVGDVLEYEYTIYGENPVFAGQFVHSISLGWRVPVGRVYRSLLWPADRPIQLLLRRTDRQPERRRGGDVIRYVWDESKVPPVLPEGDLPDWYDPLPWAQLSTFGSWAEVVEWGRALFALPASAPEELRRQVLEQVGEAADPADLTVTALRLVQDEIRYLYIGLVESSHRPSPPDLVVERRFGDCKDKALLLVSLLHSLGVDAAPALVATDWGDHVEELLPSPLDFDHAIVRARIDGRSYWLDPTDTHQRGDLERLVPPPWGAALVLAEGVEDLEPISRTELEEPETEIVTRFELSDGTTPVEIAVETTYRGSEADRTRYTMRSSSPEELRKSFVEFYADLYPSIEAAAPVQWEDDPEANRVVVREQYRVPGFWDEEEGSAWLLGELYPLELEYRLHRPATPIRTMPLAVPHPEHLRYVIEARTDGGWSVPAGSRRVDGDAFVLDYAVETEGDVLRLSYRYRSKVDHLPPEAAPSHVASVQEAFDLLSFPIQLPAKTATVTGGGLQNVNWPILLTGLLALTGLGVLATRLYRWAPVPLPVDPLLAARAPEGLGGWLALLGLGLVFSPFKIGFDLSSTFSTYSLPIWSSLTTPGSERFHPLWAPFLIGELVLNLSLLVCSVLLLFLYFKKRRAFPWILVGFLLAAPVAIWLDGALVAWITKEPMGPEEVRGLGGVAVRSLVWSWYAMASVRVRKTFVS